MLLTGSALASPQATLEDLKQVEKQLAQTQQASAESQRKAALLSRQVKEVQGDLASTGQKIQKKENELSALEQQQRELEQKKSELEAKLMLSDKQLYRVMKGMQTLSLRPPELLMVQKKTPIDTLRSRLLMRYSIPVIGQMSEETRQDLIKLMEVRDQMGRKLTRIKQVHLDLTDQNEKINRLLQQKKLMQAQYTSEYMEAKKKAQTLAAKAQDLKDLLKKLEEDQAAKRRQQPVKPMGTGSFARAMGRLNWPVGGSITQRFGAQSASGAHAKGIVLKTRSNARVMTPFDGTVLFAGPFQNYGQLLIVDHGDAYLTVMAGMAHIDVSVGQELLAGEPVATMGTNYADLYVELRYQGQAIDPEPWFVKKGGV